MTEITERFFGSDEYSNLDPATAAVQKAKQMRRMPIKPTTMETLLQQNTEKALNEMQRQIRQVAQEAEAKMKDLKDELKAAIALLRSVADGTASMSDVKEFLISKDI